MPKKWAIHPYNLRNIKNTEETDDEEEGTELIIINNEIYLNLATQIAKINNDKENDLLT